MTGSEFILLVEDNEDDVFLMKRAMKAAGITNPLCVVEDGQLALDYLSGAGKYSDRTAFPLPAVVFLDLKLPFVRGLDVLKWLREDRSFSSIVVLILTSSEEPSDLKEAYLLGANSYLVKPPTVPELLKLATDFKSYWIQHNKFESESK